MQEKHEPTPTARRYAKKLLKAAEQDPVITVDEVADILKVNRRNAQKWLTRLDSLGLIDRSFVQVSQYRGRCIYISKILPPRASEGSINDVHGGVAATPPILISSRDKTMIKEKSERKRLGGVVQPEQPDQDEGTQDFEASGFAEKFDSLFSEGTSQPRQHVGPEILSVLPPYPDCRAICEPARSPPHPRLSGADKYDIDMCIRAFTSVSRHRYGRARRVDASAKYRLKKVVKVMRDCEILHPYAWAMFRMQAWEHGRRADGTGGRPGIDSVFAVPLILSSAEVFKDQRHKFMVPKGQLAPSHIELGKLWNEAREALLGNPRLSRLDAQSVVNGILSPAKYNELRDAARSEVEALNAQFRKDLRAGKWVWGATA